MDIDVDFETDRRQEVIDYVVNKHKGKAVQICSYGEYNIDNLVNDLAKVCGLLTDKTVEEYEQQENKKTIAEIKQFIHSYEDEGKLNLQLLLEDERTVMYNDKYDNIIEHFRWLYGKIRYLGKHAAGVAVVGTDICDYTCFVKRGDMYSSCFDLNDLEHINCIKFDMLGLKTMGELRELEEYTGHIVTEDEFEADEIFKAFKEGKTAGVFQMEKGTPKKILEMIQCDCMEDLIAVNALNRPAPLQLRMHETYAKNKLSGKTNKKSPYYKYTKETYGTMLYQEQTVEVAQKLGHLTAEQSFDMLKIMKKADNLTKPEYIPIIEQMKKDFFAGCRKEGLTKSETASIWASMLIYGFNKGHSTGYSIISAKQMFYKLHFPAIFWFVKMKYAGNENDIYKFSECAVKDGAVVFLPHVNHGGITCMRSVDGEQVIQQGLNIIKGVGDKAAKIIADELREHGTFKDYDDFYDRCKCQSVNNRVINILHEQGALEFNEKKYVSRVIKYNSSMLGR